MRVLPPFVLALVLLSTFLLKLRHLDHTALTHWDEVFHAVVAQNLLKHPLKPTLMDDPYLPYDSKKWLENHVWLHKPILPLWQIALSFAALGINTFALRLPSVILSTGAAWLTYLIGKELFDRRAALIAAALQAANPFLLKLVQGRQFADHIDIALLFWVEVGIYFLTHALRTGSWRDLLLAGVAQGLGYLSKSYLAGIIFGMALCAWLLPICRLGKREDFRIGPARLLGLFAATVLTAAPWLAYCLIHYPEEFQHEHVQVWRHLYSQVEIWGAPWDRLVFDYLIALYGVFYTPILVAAVILFRRALTQRHKGLLLVYAWGLGVLLPHLLAVTKTPSATVIGMPAFLLLLGYLVSEACRGERWSLAALTAIVAISVIFPAVIRNPGYGHPSSRVFAGIMHGSMWVIGHIAGALAVVGFIAGIWLSIGRRLAPGGLLGRSVRATALVFCLAALSWLGFATARAAWRDTNTNLNDPGSTDVGQFARRHLPDNAVLLCEGSSGGEHLSIMFYADRTCYALAGRGPDEMARHILRAGGIPYLVSHRRLPFVPVYVSARQGGTIYRWSQQ